MPEELRTLLVWIAENVDCESAFLSPVPAWSVLAHPLLDQCAKIWGLTREEVGAVINPVRERIESGAPHG